MCGSVKKLVKKALGIPTSRPSAPPPPAPPAQQVEAPKEEQKEVDTNETTESEVKNVRARGKKGLIVKRSKLGQRGLNI